MSNLIEWIAAEADPPGQGSHASQSEIPTLAHSARKDGPPTAAALEHYPDGYEEERERRIYRGRTVAMLRRYMRYSMETGRLPSLLGREFFRAKVTSYTVVTFEDRVIFVHDMEKCLDRLDEFSRQLIARHILQEHDRAATARLLHCSEKTVRRLMPLALDVLSEILIDVGLLERMESSCGNCCQGGVEAGNLVSDCEDGKNKF
jgi:AraC-like DNA-binding protein